ncbi:probable polygalacturonase At3g15720 isoform X2 [Eutrema salsugineum]|uniref:probable polygalacturonase At3g15720 isoform X2 n=1 Tax=Eutrema salsugineum TaxID=72664 RepID=UPI000CED35BC|nr:probable polygalacturonase At3g15720 isoform X2 [Eutrema salsugineum]
MTLSIRDFLSDSDHTNVDHSQAFQDAWKALCGAKENEANSLVIHANETYTILPQLFQGPCVSRNLHIQIDGKIEAPTMVKGWGSKKSEYWLCFEKVTGLVLNGSGVLNTHGGNWWSSVEVYSRPEAVRFFACNDIIYNGITQMDSPKNHISVLNCVNATISNLRLIAPANSPNTDGIDICLSHNIHIFDSSIETGDDCVAINGSSYDINITRVACGPGHGISIGSLGKGGAMDTVQNVNVRDCTFSGTANGARIKTWPGTAVKVSDVTFKYFKGTCSGESDAIKLDCDKNVGCDNIVMEHINITSSSPKTLLHAFCQFAHVISRFVSIDIKCDAHDHKDPQPPSPFPALAPSTPYAKPPSPDAQPPTPIAQPPLFSFPFLYFD